jgi:hypothetical protein
MIWTWTDELEYLPTIGFFSCSYINDSDWISHFRLALEETLAKYMVQKLEVIKMIN